MVLFSLVLHVGAIAAVVMASGQRPLELDPKAYTVSLIDPAALAGKASLRPEKDVGQQPKTLGSATNEAVPKASNPRAAKDSPVETVKHSGAASRTPKPKKALVKLPLKGKPKKEKQSPAKKIEKKRTKKVTSKRPESPSNKAKRKKAAPGIKPSPKKVATKAKKDSVSVQERDEQRLSAAIERIRKNIEGNARQLGQTAVTQQGREARSSGDGRVQGLAFLMYTEQVKQRVKESWIVTQTKTGLKVVVQFGVRPSGDIIDVEMVRSSGNYTFDQSALRAVHNANPLPPPPQEYQQEFINQKVKVAFGK